MFTVNYFILSLEKSSVLLLEARRKYPEVYKKYNSKALKYPRVKNVVFKLVIRRKII